MTCNPLRTTTIRWFGASSSRNLYRVLGIESSCDDSCASVVDSDRRVLSNVRLNQNDIHKPFQGIHPYHAIQAHQINLPIAIGRALEHAKLELKDIHAIAYTRGPGIAGCLAVGATAAKTLSVATGKPLLAVHHMQAHALTPFLTQNTHHHHHHPPLQFPFLSLLVSGGHTLLLLVSSSSTFKILAETADKPLGLAIDKISRALDVPWPAGSGSPGSALEAFAGALGADEEGLEDELGPLPLALRTGPSVFSFCGLQTATMRRIEAIPHHLSPAESLRRRRLVAAAFFHAAFGQIEMKISHWIARSSHILPGPLNALVLSGGVGSNLLLRNRIEKLLRSIDFLHVELHVPPVAFCTDNAAMVAWTGIDKLARGKVSSVNRPVAPSWSIEDAEDETSGSAPSIK